MDISSSDSDWLSELMQEMDDNNEPHSLMYECENILSSLIVNPDTTSTPHQLPSNDYQLPSPDMSINLQSTDSLLQKSSTSSPPAPPEVSSSSSSPPPSKIICFGNPSSPMDDPTKAGFSYGNYLTTMGATVLGTKSNTVHKHQQAGNTAYSRRVQSAVIKPLVAERNRREKLNEHFIALSAQIPALKKIDRASVLEEATKYLKQLKEKVKTLEEEHKSLKMSTTTKTTRSSDETADVAIVNKKMKRHDNKQVENSENRDNNNKKKNYDSDDTNVKGNYGDERLLPEIEAKVSHNNMFIRIHCTKHQGVLGKVIKEMEKLHLTVLQSSVMPSGNSTLYITIISQMNIEFCLTAKDIVKNLKATFRQFGRVTAT